MQVHVCLAVRDDCKNLADSYGEICVKCNKCGRFNKKEDDGGSSRPDDVSKHHHDATQHD